MELPTTIRQQRSMNPKTYDKRFSERTCSLEDTTSSKGEVGRPVRFVGMRKGEGKHQDNDDQVCDL